MKLTTKEKMRLVVEGVITAGIILLMYVATHQIMTRLAVYILDSKREVWFEEFLIQIRDQQFWGLTPYVGVFLLIIMGILVYWRLKRRLRQYELSHIIDELHYIAQGNFEHRIRGQYRDEVKRVVESIHMLVDSALQAMEEERLIEQSKDELITNVSHDIRTPLTSIIGYLGLIEHQRYHSETELTQYASVAFEKAQQMKVLVDNLFEYTKVRQTTTPLNLTQFDMVQLLEQLVIDFELEAEKQAMQLTVSTQAPHVHMQGDTEKLVRAVSNLLSNALKYGSDGDQVNVNVTCHEPTDEVIIQIKNNGTPLEATHLEDIFERFYRAEESRSQAIEGSGLGLAITKSIIDLHHGNISARVEAGWTIFQITLPRIQVVQNGGE